MKRLIERWQAGDERAAEAIYNQFRESTFRLAYLLLGDRGDAEEVAQDALNYALVNIDHYDPNRASFKGWINLITVSRCRDRQRRKFFPKLSLSAWLGSGKEITDSTYKPEESTLYQEASNEVMQAVRQLKPHLREAILLRHWAGHSYKDIATILGCPTRTAQSRVRLAHNKLRSMLSEAELVAFEQRWSR